MNNPSVFDLGSLVIGAAGESVITEGADSAGQITGLAGMQSVSLFAKFSYGSGGTTLGVIVQTSFDQGQTWVDVCRFDFTTASANKVANLSAAAAVAPAVVTELSVEGKVDGLLGDRLRAKRVSVGTYASSSLALRAAVR